MKQESEIVYVTQIMSMIKSLDQKFVLIGEKC